MNLDELITPEISDMEPALTRKAVLWGRDDVLTQAVHSFLEAGTNWKVARVSSSDDIRSLFQKVIEEKPDVVVFCQDRVFEDSMLQLSLINEQLCRKVVTVSLESNQVQVYSKQDFLLQGGSDLLSIIEDGNFSTCTLGKKVKRGQDYL